MKKSIFDLTSAERKKVEKELRATSYGKSLYFLANSVIIAIVALVVIDVLTLGEGEELFNDSFITFLFISFFVQIFLSWKWLQLVKVYYDEKEK